jgi:hypothetical protein
MALVGKQGTRLVYNCQGCHGKHYIPVEVDEHNKIIWSYNNDENYPTITPSVKVTYNGDDAGKQREGGNYAPAACCHHWITDGVITYCDDSTHEMRGKSYWLPEFVEDKED